MERTDNMQEQMRYVKNQQEMLEIKTTATEMNNAFNGFMSRFKTVEESVSLKVSQ